MKKLTRPQIEAIARGLYFVANSDGIDARESGLIREFLKDAGAPELEKSIQDGAFDPDQIARTLDTEWLRATLVKAAVLLVRSDGSVSAGEHEAMAFLCRALKVSVPLAELEAAVAKEHL